MAGCIPGESLAGFAACPTSGAAPIEVQFTDQSQIVKADRITAWSWDFGDGATSAERHPSHTHTIPGVHTVSLTVTSDRGRTDTATQEGLVTVEPAKATIMLSGDVPLEMVWVAAGEFVMGSYPGGQGGSPNGFPQHPPGE